MKKLLLLVGLVVFITPSMVIAIDEGKVNLRCKWEQKIEVRNDENNYFDFNLTKQFDNLDKLEIDFDNRVINYSDNSFSFVSRGYSYTSIRATLPYEEMSGQIYIDNTAAFGVKNTNEIHHIVHYIIHLDRFSGRLEFYTLSSNLSYRNIFIGFCKKETLERLF